MVFRELFFGELTSAWWKRKKIVRQYLTLHPRLIAAKELKSLVNGIANEDGIEFENKYRHWKSKWVDTLSKSPTLKSGKT